MAFDITLGQYIPGDSFVHNLDPRTKLIIAIALIVVLFPGQYLCGLLLDCAVPSACYDQRQHFCKKRCKKH